MLFYSSKSVHQRKDEVLLHFENSLSQITVFHHN